MLTFDRFDLQQVRLHIYTADLGFNVGRALAALLPDHRAVFNGLVTTLPLPPDAPAEVPRIILASADGSCGLELGPERLTLTLNNIPSIKPQTSKGIDLAERVLQSYQSAVTLRVSRLALNVARSHPIAKPAMAIVDHFCREQMIQSQGSKGPLGRTETFELHAHKRYKLFDDLQVNSWLRCKSSILKISTTGSTDAIMIEQDINTLSEEMPVRRFAQPGERGLSEVLGRMDTESDDILRLYFPGESDD